MSHVLIVCLMIAGFCFTRKQINVLIFDSLASYFLRKPARQESFMLWCLPCSRGRCRKEEEEEEDEGCTQHFSVCNFTPKKKKKKKWLKGAHNNFSVCNFTPPCITLF